MSRTISKEEIEFRRRTAIRLNTREEVRAFILGILSCARVFNVGMFDAKMVAKCVFTELPDDKDFVRTHLEDLDDRGAYIAVQMNQLKAKKHLAPTFWKTRQS